jgi:hypothetical protein
MSWTVRYSLYKSNFWKSAINNIGTDRLSAGATAYAHRKQVMWHQLALISDQSFRLANSDYESPL